MSDANPKDLVGATKVPLSLVPQTAIALASLGHLEGALKYGRWNWRAKKIQASIYLDAIRRHLAAWENGEEKDPSSGLHPLAHAMAGLNIMVDAMLTGKLIDDRPPRADMQAIFGQLAGEVQRLTEKYADKHPHHYTIKDEP